MHLHVDYSLEVAYFIVAHELLPPHQLKLPIGYVGHLRGHAAAASTSHSLDDLELHRTGGLDIHLERPFKCSAARNSFHCTISTASDNEETPFRTALIFCFRSLLLW